MFLDPLPAFRRSVNRCSPTKPSAMKIPQYGPTDFHTLENADEQNAIALLPPKSHTNFYRILSTWEHRRDSTSAGGDRCTPFAGHWYGAAKRN
jgi:hypothetical protein